MKHTSVLHQAERWTKNAARTLWKQMTYENALKALAVASVVPVLGAAAGAVRAGIAAGSATQVIGGNRDRSLCSLLRFPHRRGCLSLRWRRLCSRGGNRSQ